MVFFLMTSLSQFFFCTYCTSNARKYLRHHLKTREILSMLVDRTNFKDEKGFSELMPIL